MEGKTLRKEEEEEREEEEKKDGRRRLNACFRCSERKKKRMKRNIWVLVKIEKQRKTEEEKFFDLPKFSRVTVLWKINIFFLLL